MRPLHYAALALAVVSAASAQERTVAPAEPQSCLAPAAWYTLDATGPRRAAAETVLRDAARRRVVLLGEQHDSAEDHAWQLQTLATLHFLHPQLVIGFEAFPRRVQPVLDRWIAGELSAQQLLEQTEWDKVWRFPPALYLPLFEFARLNRIPMVALNVDHTLSEAVGANGWDAVPDAQKEGITRPAAASRAYEDLLYDVYLAHAKEDAARKRVRDRNDPAFRHFVESQLTWDRAMAEALAARWRASGSGTPPLVVGIAGSGHLRHQYGIAHQLRDLDVLEVATLLPSERGEDCTELKAGLADAVFAIARAPREAAPRPRLGVQLGGTAGGVAIVAVTPGSLAEKTGLRKDDRVVMLAGTPVKSAGRIAAAVRAQPPGTWLPIQVHRGDETLELVIRFPPEK
jgi:uncharacterized iron-regulated protein